MTDTPPTSFTTLQKRKKVKVQKNMVPYIPKQLQLGSWNVDMLPKVAKGLKLAAILHIIPRGWVVSRMLYLIFFI